MAERVGLRGSRRSSALASFERRALGDDDDRVRRAVGVARPQQLADRIGVVGPLGHEDRVGAGRDPGVGRDPAGVPTHHLDDDHAVVRLRRRAQPVDRVGRDLHRGVKAERHLGPAEVVVDRLGHPDDRDAAARSGGSRRRACPRRRSRSARRRPAPRARRGSARCRRRRRRTGWCARCRGSCRRGRGSPPSTARVELERVALEHARPSRAGSRRSSSPDVELGAAHDRADHRVESGTVAAAGEDADACHRAARIRDRRRDRERARLRRLPAWPSPG